MALKIVESAGPVAPEACVTGAAMDRPLPKRRLPYALWAMGATLALAGILSFAWLFPHGLRVTRSDLRIATVLQETFHNDVLVRTTAQPLHTIMLDVLETGRVEEVLVNDGAMVAKGALLFRLSNSQLRLNLVARQAERAQQVNNLSALRVAIEASQTEHQRRVLELRFSLSQAEKLYARNALLMKNGVISGVSFDESRDRLEQQHQALRNETTRHEIELRTKREGVRQMERAVGELNEGLKVVNESIDALNVRAPIAGRLTDFHLQLGEIVKSEQRVGRIDDPSQFKLMAEIEEYYLGNVTKGKTGSVNVNGHDYAVEINRVFPQIKEGRFQAELLFTSETPRKMSPGQSTETRITLGDASTALILPNDAFVNDTGGSWVFVLSSDGHSAKRRTIRLGRHNDSQVEVVSGLTSGERVIVSTYARFGKAERLRITN